MMAISPAALTTLLLASTCLAQARHPDNDGKPIATKKTHVATAAKTAPQRAEPAGPDEDDGDDEPKASLPAPSGAAVPPSAPEIIDQPEPLSPTEADDDDDDQTDQPAAVIVAARRLDAARAGINASLGASTYSFSNSLVEMRPGGETVPIGQVLLQAPGVAQTAPGQLQVRGDTTLQYRINNIIIPDGFTDLAESLSARTAQGLELVTGALPAQYGLQVGGIVNITTKSGVYEQGGQVELYGGSGEIEPAVEFATSIAGTNISMSGSYLQDDTGLSAPDGGASPLHDQTRQWDGFAYVDHAVDDRSRISLILGGTAESFQLPNDTDLDAATATSARTGFQRPLSVNGVTHYRSEDRDAREDDSGLYGIVSYLWANDRLTLQASGFLHRSTYGLTSDGIGDLLFSGLSQQVRDKQTTAGLQIETSYRIGNAHVLRAGLVTSRSRQISAVSSTVLPVDPSGRQTTTAPVTLVDTATDTSSVASLFVQDEWTMTGALTLNTGLRFDHATGAAGGDQFSPRANLVWKASQNTTVHAGYARYFVPVQDDENAGRTPDLAGTTGAPPGPRGQDVRAETDDYLDIGVQRKTQALTLGIDAYWRQTSNFTAHLPIEQTALQRPFTYASGRLRGIELSATYANGPLTWWSNLAIARAEGRGIVSTLYAFTSAELADLALCYARVSQDQTYTASGGASYRWGNVHLSSDVLYGSGTPRTLPAGAVNAGRMPAHVQVNLSALWRVAGLGGKRLDLKLDIINAFDQRYAFSDGTAAGGGPAQWGPRRGVFIGAEQAF